MKKGFSRLAASVLSVSLLAGNTIIIPGMVSNADEQPVNDGFAIAEEIGLDTDSDAVAEELEQISSLNDNETPDITVSDNNEVSQIFGKLSETDVNTNSDALKVIDEISDLLGINDTYSDLRFESCINSLYNDIYSFKQYYKGLEMVNSYVTVIVNKNTREPKCINNTYKTDFSIGIEPQITDAQALEIAKASCEDYMGSAPRLVIYTGEDDVTSLAWECNADTLTTGKIYVDAINGNILFTEKTVQNVKIPTDGVDEPYNVNYNEYMPKVGPFSINLYHHTDTKTYYFRDKRRNIEILQSDLFWGKYDDDNKISIFIKEDGKTKNILDPTCNFGGNVLYKYVEDDNSYKQLSNYTSEIAAMYNVERAYDFYNDIFHWRGANGRGGKLRIIPALRDEGKYPIQNAYAFGGFNLIAFGAEFDDIYTPWGADHDIAVHEYTHLVSHEKLGWGGSANIETAALNEAYSDIMAEYADDTREWKTGNDLYYKSTYGACLRDLASPQSPCLRKYEGKGSLENEDPKKQIDSHYASTIISHIAYVMHDMGIEEEVGMRIWYGSMDYLINTEMDFQACRKAVIKAVTDAVFDKEFNGKYNDYWWDYKLITNAAFLRSNVLPEELLGDLDHDGVITKNDANLLKKHLEDPNAQPYDGLLIADINMDSYIDMDDYCDYFFRYTLI